MINNAELAMAMLLPIENDFGSNRKTISWLPAGIIIALNK